MIVVVAAGARDVACGQILTISSTRLTRAQGRTRYGAMIGTPAGRDGGVVSRRYGSGSRDECAVAAAYHFEVKSAPHQLMGGGPMRR